MRAKKFDLDDIGHIGGERPFTEEDSRAISAYLQAQRAKRPGSKRTTKRATAKRRTRAKARVTS